MPIIGTKRVIQAAALGCWLVSGSVLVWVWSSAVSLPPVAPGLGNRISPHPKDSPPSPASDLSDRWATLFERRLQRPVHDPPVKPPPVVAEKPSPPPSISLVGTMPEPGGGHALVRDAQGRESLVRQGATIKTGGTTAKLLKVHRDRIEMEYNGKTITISTKSG